MGKSDDNVLTHGLRGKIGDLLVYRILKNGKTIVAKTPSTANRTQSEKQKQQVEHFQEAVIYGKTVKVTPELRELYETSIPVGKSVYQVALADFLKAPKISKIDVTNYTGEVGSILRIHAIDDFKVKEVSVTIRNSDGSLVESGKAVLELNGVTWLYTATQNNTDLDGDKIIVRASDIPGNIGEEELDLN
ncbi:MAG: hypothetical protein HC905_04585 [Bacteroidales bacterium]|nr:hypothetical protein [Bacteroidales bacterium]